MRYYVSLDGVTDQQLEFLGYYLVDENDEFKIYNHKGDDILVDKSDPFMYVDDVNDANLLGSEIFSI